MSANPNPYAIADAPVAELLEKALARPGVSKTFDGEGTHLHALTWNAEAKELPGLLFLHGFLGHAHWWDFIAPSFSDRWRVAALDLSGMGDSGWRSSYDSRRHARDILLAIDALGFAPATVIAHSYSGSRLVLASTQSPGSIARAVLLDAYVNLTEAEVAPHFRGERRVYPDEATALGRFRLHPPQPEPWPELVRHIGRHSIRQESDGWTWKFDPAIQSRYEADAEAMLRRMTVPMDCVYGEHSKVVDAALVRRVLSCAGQGREPLEVPGAHHHLIVDQPLALISALRGLLLSR